MKTIRDFMNLVEQDIDPSTVVLDPAPAPAPAPGRISGPELEKRVQTDANGKKVAPLNDQEEQLIRDLLQRMDVVLKHYRDKDGKTFESVSFESMNESEQRQYIMQNLHLLSEADQMVVLRGIMNEGPKTDAAKAVGKWALNTGEKIVGAGYRDIALPVAKFAGKMIGYGIMGTAVTLGGGLGTMYVFDGGLSRLYRSIVPASPEVDKELTPDDYKEMKKIEQDWVNLCSAPAEYLANKGIEIGYSTELAGDMFEMKERWERFRKALVDKNKTPAAPAKTEPGYADKALDTVKGLFK